MPIYSLSAQKKELKTPQRKEFRIRDSTVYEELADAESLLRKGNLKEALERFTAIYSFSKDSLRAIEIRIREEKGAFQAGEAKQEEKEKAYFRIKRMEDLEEKYREIKLRCAYYVGFIHARLGNEELARKILLDAVSDPQCNKSHFCEKPRALLRELLGIEAIF